MSHQVLSTAFLVLCGLLLYQLALIFAPFLTPILWAMILVRLFYPLYQRLRQLLRGQASVSAILSTLAVTFLAVLPVAYLAFLAITETATYLFWTAPIWKGIAMVAVGLMDNVLQPLLVGSGADLPVLFLFFASLGGLAYFGFIGLFLGPILLGIALAAFQIYRDNYQMRTGLLVLSEPGPATEPVRK